MAGYDYDTDHRNNEFGGLSASEVFAGGRPLHIYDDKIVATALSRVHESGVLAKLDAWRRDDTATFGLGGRPALVPESAVLVGLVLLASEHRALWVTNLASLLQNQLSDASRELLQLPDSDLALAYDRRARKRWYNNTFNAFHRLLDVVDPYPQQRWKSMSYAEVQAVLDAHDLQRERAMKVRLDEFTNLFLKMTFQQQPRRIRRASAKIDVSFDQTYIKPPSKKGYSKKNLAKNIRLEAERLANGEPPTVGPSEAFAGWYVTTGDRPDLRHGQADTTAPKRGENNYLWGWTLNIAVRVDSENPKQRRFPKLAVGATLSQPGYEAPGEAVELMRAASKLDLTPGVADADKAYFAQATTEQLHGPTVELGFTPSTDYRIDRLGVRGGKAGAEQIEGKHYCPGMPTPLKNATKDLLNNRITEETFQIRRAERKAFQLHEKEKPDAKGRVPLRCPALGPSPTVTCPLRELAKTLADKPRPHVDDEDPPSFADKICTQHSVSFNEDDGLREKQAFDYRSPEWDTFHKHARNSIESLNAGIKDTGREAIEESGRRRVRGFAAAQVFATILLVNYNLRRIAAFLANEAHSNDESRTAPAAPLPRRRRDRVWHNKYTGTYPDGYEKPTVEAELVPLRT